ncbi:hypothetical protein DEU56DRAFT_190227 [Suillus clintonianus]|uniref:uncharacterized protein n=1 Tax=Suillus clintonianus TaxID=1904413 RepID=UPI001B85C7FF|nr:uncharacterized protein DEU56DRAFT_190227 [Suillus clintonianus]KAG2113962.1 hypothetical protein DEU56DRAFT_190227 [Suillus clintonianus]
MVRVSFVLFRCFTRFLHQYQKQASSSCSAQAVSPSSVSNPQKPSPTTHALHKLRRSTGIYANLRDGRVRLACLGLWSVAESRSLWGKLGGEATVSLSFPLSSSYSSFFTSVYRSLTVILVYLFVSCALFCVGVPPLHLMEPSTSSGRKRHIHMAKQCA